VKTDLVKNTKQITEPGEMKIGQNQPCYCGSGKKYKLCCGTKVLPKREIVVESVCPCCGGKMSASIDMTNNLMNKYYLSYKPLVVFCKDAGFYFFEEFITMNQIESLLDKFEKNELKKEDFFDAYKSNAEDCLGFLETAIERNDFFRDRADILRDAFGAHIEGKYTLSVPVLFAQLEGLLRVYGKQTLKDSFSSRIKRGIWNRKLLFDMEENAQNFNAFVNNLYKGSQPKDAFNRNPVLHGMNILYNTQEHSLLLIMSILEIDIFLFFEKNSPDVFDNAI